MDLQNKIIEILQSGIPLRSSDIASKVGMSRKTVLLALENMLQKGIIFRIPNGPRTSYTLPKFAENILIAKGSTWSHLYNNVDLQEHLVFDDIKRNFLDRLKVTEHLQNILTYAFSEMMNNAIEHSQSKQISVRFDRTPTDITFTVRDTGIGVFRNIKQTRHLSTTLEAIQDLLKGKTTTMPKSHSGEGIFFTSKIADKFTLRSFGDTLVIDNTADDVFVLKNPRSIEGTEVIFKINIQTTKHLNDVFRPYTDQTSGDFGFNTTEIHVKLYEMGGVHISRSQARRILDGLEKFSKIILDFKDIEVIGQAFADEVFRVFKNRHPHITIKVKNAIEPVQFMIDRVAKE
jgi:anti-sigma regulatory factor (Ser/Thr protein kinase)